MWLRPGRATSLAAHGRPAARSRRAAASACRNEDGTRTRGRLKVFFGASPGVGKTYAMLEAARAGKKDRRGRGGRAGWRRTAAPRPRALLEGLRAAAARGTSSTAARCCASSTSTPRWRAGPALLLLDELAHTNAPGSRHAKRWQDAQELLDAGHRRVDHAQRPARGEPQRPGGAGHRASRCARRCPTACSTRRTRSSSWTCRRTSCCSGCARARSTCPEQAQRAAARLLPQGQPHRAARAGAAAHGRPRRRGHARLPPRRTRSSETWPVAERDAGVRRPEPRERPAGAGGAAGWPRGCTATWIVAYVETPVAAGAVRGASSESLAATPASWPRSWAPRRPCSAGESVGEAAALLRARRTTSARSWWASRPRPRWRDRLRGSLVDAIVRGSGEIDVYVDLGGRGRRRRRPRPRAARRPRAGGSASPGPRRSWPPARSCAGRCSRASTAPTWSWCTCWAWPSWPRASAAGLRCWPPCLSVAAFDFFFVPPYLTFAVTRHRSTSSRSP